MANQRLKSKQICRSCKYFGYDVGFFSWLLFLDNPRPNCRIRANYWKKLTKKHGDAIRYSSCIYDTNACNKFIEVKLNV